VHARVAKATRDAVGAERTASAVAQGSPAELRGVPVVGPDCGGSAIPGTNPGESEALDDWPTPD
jgi:hypothetical protein